MRVTVVIATYNRGATLGEALASVEHLLVPVGWELSAVVIDDGSTDGTFAELLKERQLSAREASSPYLEVVHRPGLTALRVANGERGRARNLAAAYARDTFAPDWFLFLDSDDVLVETALVRFAQRLERAQDSAAIGLCYSWCAEWNGRTSPSLGKQRFSSLPEGDLAERVLVETFIPLGATLISSAAFFSVGMFPEARALAGSEDKILLGRLALAYPVLFAPQVATWYRQHGSNTPFAVMIHSIDLMAQELSGDIMQKFPVSGAWHQEAFRQANILKKIGYAVFTRNLRAGWGLFIAELLRSPGILGDRRSWGLVARLCYRSIF